jgi:cell division protease FtsH
MIEAEDKKVTAYHEAGHAIVSINCSCFRTRSTRSTIIPRGRALGIDDVSCPRRTTTTRLSYKYMISRTGDHASADASPRRSCSARRTCRPVPQNDIEQATNLARAMVTRWGFSDELGQVAYGENQEEVFLGHSVARTQNMSEETQRKIDSEVRRLIDEAYAKAREILTEKNAEWVAIAEGLLEYETLSGDEIQQIMRGEKPARDMGDDTPTPRGSAVPKTGKAKESRKKKGGEEPDAGGMEPQPQG